MRTQTNLTNSDNNLTSNVDNLTSNGNNPVANDAIIGGRRHGPSNNGQLRLRSIVNCRGPHHPFLPPVEATSVDPFSLLPSPVPVPQRQ